MPWQDVLRREARENRDKLDMLSTARLESLKCSNSKCPLRNYDFTEEERKIRTGLLIRQTIVEELAQVRPHQEMPPKPPSYNLPQHLCVCVCSILGTRCYSR